MTTTITETRASHTLSCGHQSTPRGIATGYAVRTSDGAHICYDCADAEQVAEVADPATTTFVGYVAENTITTWTGGVLGWVIRRKHGSVRFSSLGLPMQTVCYSVGTPDGRLWYGRHNVDGGDALVLHLRKRSAR